MRHLLVISAVICAVIGNGWAQSRGSSRYTPSEQHFDEDPTRAPRPTRGAGVRRQRITTKAPEPAAVEEEVKAFQPADNPVRTTARRVPQRGNLQQVAPPPPPSLPVDDAVPRFAAPAEELSPAPPAVPESRPPGTRRRRPKKRRRPQNTVPKEAEETEKQVLVVSSEEKTSLSDLINEDKKRNGVFQSNPSSRNSLPTYNSDSVYQAEKSQWENKQSPELQNNAAGSKYYEPQPAVNRLPVGEPEPVGNSRGYLESSPAVPVLDAPASYVSPTQPKDTSYVPILNPNRVPSDGSSRLPLENYATIQNKDATRLLSNPNIPLRGHSNRSPTATLEEIPRAKPVLNIIPQSDGPPVPVRSYSEVRLPEEQPLISSPYVSPALDASEDFSSPNSKISEDIKDPANPSNRLPNPSEIHYDSTYPEFSGDQVRVPQRVAGRRQETDEPIARNPLPSYTIPRRDVGTKPHEYDNDAEVDRRQVSQYRPPLQRAGSRFKSDDPNKPIERSREQIQPQSIPASRTRGTSRYQPSTTEYIPEKTRTRSETEPQADSPNRSRSSSTSQSSTRTRGPQRFTSDTVETVRRTTPRKPPVDAEEVPRNTATTGYIPIEEFIENEEKSERTLQSPRSHSQSSRSLATDKELDSQFLDKDSTPLRGTLRSRPQYEIRTLPSPRSHSQSSRSIATDKDLDSQFLDKDSTPLRGTLRSQPQHEIRTLPSPRSHSQSSRSIATDKDLDSQFLDKDSTPLRGTLRSQPQHEIRTLPSPRSHSQSSRSIATDKELETRYLDKDTTPLRGTLRSQPQYETREADPTDRFEESIEEPDIYRPDYHLPPQANSRSRLNQAAPYPNQPAPQTAYQLPPNRQQNRPESHYESPQNYRSRQQPQYQAPQNPRTDSRQTNSRQNLPSSGTQSRSRHQSEPSAASPRSSAGRNDFECPDAFGFFADPVQCDKYYECRNGTAEMHLCSDGLAFNQVSSPKFLRCDSLRDVDCSSRPKLQEPQSTQNCPRRFGLFPHETDCTKFWNCVDGVATEVQCPPGLTYSDERATCDWADLVESSCKSEDLLGFTCPEPTAHDLLDGVYARYPNPDNCQLHFTCIKGADGLRRPRMLSCNEGLVFDPVTSSCRRPEEVPGCENFYGGRSQTPNKKPARREPEPISEEIVEEPTPRPRRRGPNRRVRS